MGTLGADGVEKRHQVIDVVPHLERMTRLIGISVAEHVDRPGGEVLGVGLQVAHVCLGMAAGPVEKHQRRPARVTGMQVAGAHSACVEVALRERDALKIAPDALEPPHSSPSPDRENLILVFCKHTLLIYRTSLCTMVRASLSRVLDVKTSPRKGPPWLRRPVRRAAPPRRTVHPDHRRWPGAWRRCS